MKEDDINNNAEFNIKGNPGTGNTFINVKRAINVNTAPTTVVTTINIGANGLDLVEGTLSDAAIATPKADDMADGPKLNDMSYRALLRNGYIDTKPLRTAITVYVNKIRCYVKNDKLNVFDHLWTDIFNLDIMKIELFDPGKQKSCFNRNLVANIICYLNGKGFYNDEYNPNDMARALEEEKGADSPVTKALRCKPDKEYCDAIDCLLKELDS